MMDDQYKDDMDQYKDDNEEKDLFPASSSTEAAEIVIAQNEYDMEEDAIQESLKQQIQEEWDRLQQTVEQDENQDEKKAKSGSLRKRIMMSILIVFGILLVSTVFLVGTKPGRSILYKIAGNYISHKVDRQEITSADTTSNPINEQAVQTGITNTGNSEDTGSQPGPMIRSEDYVSNYLIFGLEEIENAKNTDSIMVVSVNTKDKSIKLTSLLRDTYMEFAGKPCKLNSIYARDGIEGLMSAIELNYRIKLDGYAYINFSSFEDIIDYLGGISIELGEEEADYLNRKNYISDPANRNVKPGWNLLNGNQALGYCRVRKCVTLGGANDDYGRTLRQRRVLEAIFNQYKSKNIIVLLSIMNDCLRYVHTNLSSSQIEKLMEDVVENKITTMETIRIPKNGAFEAMEDYNGVDDPLVIDWEANRKELYKFIFLDEEEN